MSYELKHPETLEEALQILGGSNGAKLLAGGTDVMVGMRVGKIDPEMLIDLSRISDLAGIHSSHHFSGGLFIGALTRIRDIERAPELGGGWKVLSQAAGTLASVQIRNLATLGGNICNAAPSADTATSLLVLDAAVEIAGSDGRTIIPLEEFFKGPGLTVLGSDRILIGFHLPLQPDRTAGAYVKHGARKAMDCCTLGVAALVSSSEGKIDKARIAIGAVAPVPMRVHAAEDLIQTRGVLTEDVIESAADLAMKAARPIDDVRGQAWYRRDMIAVDTRRALAMIAQELER